MREEKNRMNCTVIFIIPQWILPCRELHMALHTKFCDERLQSIRIKLVSKLRCSFRRSFFFYRSTIIIFVAFFANANTTCTCATHYDYFHGGLTLIVAVCGCLPRHTNGLLSQLLLSIETISRYNRRVFSVVFSWQRGFCIIVYDTIANRRKHAAKRPRMTDKMIACIYCRYARMCARSRHHQQFGERAQTNVQSTRR